MKALLAALLLAAPAATAGDLRDALQVGDLICEFREARRGGPLGELVDAPPASGLLLVYESVTPDSAQVLSTEAPGRRLVRVRATGKAVHFIERVGSSVRVTTLTACERRALRGGVRTCVRYRAWHAWLFDSRVSSDPDRALGEALPGASAGRCEPWRVE